MIRLLAATAVLLLSACATSEGTARPEAPISAHLGRDVIKSAALEISREDPAGGVKHAEALANRLGGYAQSTSAEYATLLVPSAKLDQALDELATLGKVEHRDVRADDVTEAKADLELRLDNLRRTRDRYLQLLDKANDVQETLVVERELERITLEIERLEAQLQHVTTRVALATIDVRFARPVRPGPVGWVLYGMFSAVKWLFVWS